jgi:hypothetical protein
MKYYLHTPAVPKTTEFHVTFAQPETKEIPCTVISTLGDKSFIRYSDKIENTIWRWVPTNKIIEK